MSAINAISTGLSVISFTFFLVGIIGYSPETGVFQDIPWVVVKAGNTQKYLFGTQGFYVDVPGQHNVVLYGDNDCNSDFCDNCEWDGQVVGGLLVIALVFTAVVIGLSGATITTVSKPLGISNIVMSFTAFAVSLVGIVSFMGRCFSEIDHVFPSKQPEWGPGSILSIIGMVLMGVVFLLQVAGVAIKGGN